MRISESLYPPRPKMPGGARPENDRAYLAWRDEFLCEAEERDVARRWHDAADRPKDFRAHRFDAFLFGQPAFGKPEPPLYSHRLRSLATLYRDQPGVLAALARRFVEQVKA